jgi:hypothetical protein
VGAGGSRIAAALLETRLAECRAVWVGRAAGEENADPEQKILSARDLPSELLKFHFTTLEKPFQVDTLQRCFLL